MFFCKKMHLQIKTVFQRNRVFFLKTSLSADNVGFFRETYFSWEKPILPGQIMWVFQKNPLYLREIHIIWSDTVSLLDQLTFRKT